MTKRLTSTLEYDCSTSTVNLLVATATHGVDLAEMHATLAALTSLGAHLVTAGTETKNWRPIPDGWWASAWVPLSPSHGTHFTAENRVSIGEALHALEAMLRRRLEKTP
jgi:hypothetical protein